MAKKVDGDYCTRLCTIGKETGPGEIHKVSSGFSSHCQANSTPVNDRGLDDRFLKGHTGFCTTLKLRGNRLMSGSYDEYV